MTASEDLFPWEEPADGEPQGTSPETATDEGAEAIDAADADAPAPDAALADRAQDAVAPPAADAQAADADGTDGPAPDDADAEGGLEAAAARVARERPIAQKEYYSISEVCDLVGLKPHVLRYWETQFQVLNPSKNRSGNRVYQRKEIRLILLVKHLLYEEKYTVEGARQKIEQLRRGGRLREATTVALDAQLLSLLRDDLRQLLDILKPTATE